MEKAALSSWCALGFEVGILVLSTNIHCKHWGLTASCRMLKPVSRSKSIELEVKDIK